MIDSYHRVQIRRMGIIVPNRLTKTRICAYYETVFSCDENDSFALGTA